MDRPLATIRRVTASSVGREGLSALIDYALKTFAVDTVWIQHAAANMNARRVPVSLGMSYNTDSKYGKLVWSAYRHSWRADTMSGG